MKADANAGVLWWDVYVGDIWALWKMRNNNIQKIIQLTEIIRLIVDSVILFQHSGSDSSPFASVFLWYYHWFMQDNSLSLWCNFITSQNRIQLCICSLTYSSQHLNRSCFIFNATSSYPWRDILEHCAEIEHVFMHFFVGKWKSLGNCMSLTSISADCSWS